MRVDLEHSAYLAFGTRVLSFEGFGQVIGAVSRSKSIDTPISHHQLKSAPSSLAISLHLETSIPANVQPLLASVCLHSCHHRVYKYQLRFCPLNPWEKFGLRTQFRLF